MPLYRPKSFLVLLLLGFLFVSIPLLAALLKAELFMSGLARQSADIVFRSVSGTEYTRQLEEQILAMERKARQYLVLGDSAIQDELRAKHGAINNILHQITALPLPAKMETLVDQLQRQEQAIVTTIIHQPHDSPASQTAVKQFQSLNTLSNQLHAAGNAMIFDAVGGLQQSASHAREVVLWMAISMVLVTIFFIFLFANFLSRPIRAIDKSIRGLGAGDFTTPIQIRGPQDLVLLGERLEWLREELDTFEREKSKFVAHISHELKTPLASIREGSELLAEEEVGTLNEQQLEIAEICRKNSIQLHKLIDNLLGYNMARAKSTVLNKNNWQLEGLIEDVLADHKPVILKKGLTLDSRLDPVTVYADKNLIRAVVDNLISNGLKHAPDKSTLNIFLAKRTDRITLDVIDAGPGVAAKDAKRIFEPFFQGKALSSAPVKGTGLGLAIAREYIIAHDGKLELITDGSAGAHFRVTLPLSTSTPT